MEVPAISGRSSSFWTPFWTNILYVTLWDNTSRKRPEPDNPSRFKKGLYRERHIPQVKYDKIHGKPWKRLIVRFAKMFKIPADLTPNLNRKRNEGALQFLLHKRFIENSFGRVEMRVG